MWSLAGVENVCVRVDTDISGMTRGADGRESACGVCITARLSLIPIEKLCRQRYLFSLLRPIADRYRIASQHTRTRTHLSAVLRTVLPPTLAADQRAPGYGCWQTQTYDVPSVRHGYTIYIRVGGEGQQVLV